MSARVVKALVPTALAATLLSREFPLANLDTDGTLFTVVIYGAGYADALARIRAWMTRSHIGLVLVTDGETGEELLFDVTPRRARSPLSAVTGRDERSA